MNAFAMVHSRIVKDVCTDQQLLLLPADAVVLDR